MTSVKYECGRSPGCFVGRKNCCSTGSSPEASKTRVVARHSYGFCTNKTMEVAIYQNLGKLPPPELGRRFPEPDDFALIELAFVGFKQGA